MWGGVGCVQGRELGVRTLSSGVYPGGEDIVYDGFAGGFAVLKWLIVTC